MAVGQGRLCPANLHCQKLTVVVLCSFATVAVVTCGVLIPINLIYNLNNVPSSSRNFLSSLTISNVKGNWLYAHVALSYIICFIAFWFIWSK